MIETFQRFVMAACLAAFAVSFAAWALCAMRRPLDVMLSRVRRHPWATVILSPAVFALFVYGSTKPDPITPTVRGIILGSPMETPSSVALEWKADEGREIRTNQLVRVYWRDAYTPWTLAAEGYGMTNAVINGFFVNRDTDWMVEVEDDEDEGGGE